MTVLPRWQTRIDIDGAYTRPYYPPRSVNEPIGTVNPLGVIDRFGESLGIVSFGRIKEADMVCVG